MLLVPLIHFHHCSFPLSLCPILQLACWLVLNLLQWLDVPREIRKWALPSYSVCMISSCERMPCWMLDIYQWLKLFYPREVYNEEAQQASCRTEASECCDTPSPHSLCIEVNILGSWILICAVKHRSIPSIDTLSTTQSILSEDLINTWSTFGQ